MNIFKITTLAVSLSLYLNPVSYAQIHYDENIIKQLNREKEDILNSYKKKIRKGVLPIDGEWTDAWNNNVVAENGSIVRHYVQKYVPGARKLRYNVKIGSGINDVKYIEPGRYKSDNYDIKIISKNRILVKGDMLNLILIKVKLKDDKWFNRECNYFFEKTKKRDPVPPYIVIESIKTDPEALAPGQPFDILVDYKAADTGQQPDLPVRFSYTILKGDNKLLQSPESRLQAENGKLMNRKISLRASPETGNYEVQVTMHYKGLKMTQKTGFEISDDPFFTKKVLTYKDIEGNYIFSLGNTHANLDIIANGNGIRINHYKSDNILYEIVSYKLENKVLTFIEKDGNKQLGCWHHQQIEIDFSSPDAVKPLTSTVVDGNWCVVIGQTFKGTLKRRK